MKKVMLLSFILAISAWAQKDKIHTGKQKQEQTKTIKMDNQDILSDWELLQHTFGGDGLITKVEVSLNRNFSEYLTHTLDREQMERVNFEN